MAKFSVADGPRFSLFRDGISTGGKRPGMATSKISTGRDRNIPQMISPAVALASTVFMLKKTSMGSHLSLSDGGASRAK